MIDTNTHICVDRKVSTIAPERRMEAHYISIVVLVVCGTICTQYKPVEGEMVVLAIMYYIAVSSCHDTYARRGLRTKSMIAGASPSSTTGTVIFQLCVLMACARRPANAVAIV